MALTDKQQAFVREYLIDFNGTQAAIRAGYSENRARQTAYELLEKEEVRECVKLGQSKLEEESDVTKRDIVRMNLDIANMCKDKLDHCQKAIKASEVINKMLGYNEPDKLDVRDTRTQIFEEDADE